MAEESGKGIALVILGIVAIIAIVGLVLLFTGARKAAVCEFAVPAAKEYGGAIRGVADPDSRAFIGRSYEFPSGASGDTGEIFSGHGGPGYLQPIAETQYGENVPARAVSSQTNTAYNRQREEIWIKACTWMSTISGVNMPISLDYNEYLAWESLGRKAVPIAYMLKGDWEVKASQYGLDRDAVTKDLTDGIATGEYACGEAPNFG